MKPVASRNFLHSVGILCFHPGRSLQTIHPNPTLMSQTFIVSQYCQLMMGCDEINYILIL
jgi:hypothetical protein